MGPVLREEFGSLRGMSDYLENVIILLEKAEEVVELLSEYRQGRAGTTPFGYSFFWGDKHWSYRGGGKK